MKDTQDFWGPLVTVVGTLVVDPSGNLDWCLHGSDLFLHIPQMLIRLGSWESEDWWMLGLFVMFLGSFLSSYCDVLGRDPPIRIFWADHQSITDHRKQYLPILILPMTDHSVKFINSSILLSCVTFIYLILLTQHWHCIIKYKNQEMRKYHELTTVLLQYFTL